MLGHRFLATLACLLAVSPACADLVVVANPQSGIDRLSRDDVINIYLGRYRLLASGMSADPLDQGPESEARTSFYRALVNKSLPEINAYWARLLFSGKTRPPRALEGAESVLREVAGRHGALGYVDRGQADHRVRIVYEFGKP